MEYTRHLTLNQRTQGCPARQAAVSFSPLLSIRDPRGLPIPVVIVLGCDLLFAQLFCRLGLTFASPSSLQSFLPDFEVPCSTPFTTTVHPTRLPPNKIPSTFHLPTLRAERTALLVSSTSWTADEDFGLLLEALDIYNRVASAEGERSLPRVLVVITGKGPLKEMHMAKIQEAQQAWDFVRCVSAWLDNADYPLLLGWSFSSANGCIYEPRHRFRGRWDKPS